MIECALNKLNPCKYENGGLCSSDDGVNCEHAKTEQYIDNTKMALIEKFLRMKHEKTEEILTDTLKCFSKDEIKNKMRIFAAKAIDRESFYFDDICFMTVQKVFENYTFRWDFSYMDRWQLLEAIRRKNEWRVCFGI